MFRHKFGLFERSRRTALVALSAALLGAGLAGPLSAAASPAPVKTVASVAVKPGTPKSTGATAASGPHLAKPGRVGSASPATAAQTASKSGGKLTPSWPTARTRATGTTATAPSPTSTTCRSPTRAARTPPAW